MRARAITWLALMVLAAGARAQSPARLVDAVGMSERPDHVDINVVFGCTLRYRGESATSPTDVVRVRFAPAADCGNTTGPLPSAPPLADAARYLRLLEWDRLAGTELTLTLRLTARRDVVVVPASDGRGLRVRILLPVAARIDVGELASPAPGYAVNLDASREAFDAAAIERASQALGGAPVYVSPYELPGPEGNQTWYRLRAGPFDSRADAENLLRSARSAFPRAWLAIGDEELPAAAPSATPAAAAATQPTATPLSAADRDALLEQARRQFTRKDYEAAIPLLTRLLEQPEFTQRADVQEMMGLARERNRQLAHAKAEYEEYLRRYPRGNAVKRVRERLRALALATRAPGVSASAFAPEEGPWKLYGGVSQHYRRDTSRLDTGTTSTSDVSQDALFSDLDGLARRRGERFDFTARVDADHIKDLLHDGPGDRLRVTGLFVDLADQQLDWSARAGRQTQNTGGLFGTFDGLSGAWQLRPHLRLKAAAGYPVELAGDAPDTSRHFVAVASDFGAVGKGWDLSLYALMQQLHQDIDRQVVGAEARYFQPERTLVMLADYDLHFGALNSAFVLGSVRLPGRWTLSGNVDRRRSPLLSLRNALIGQPVDSFDELSGLFGTSELRRLARDRSAASSLYDISVARPFGERWQWSLDLAAFSLGATPASGGVPATAASGTETAVTLQGMAFGLLGGSDLSALSLRHQHGRMQDVDSLGVATRLPVAGRMRIGPSVRVDRRQLDDSRQWQYVPGLRWELTGARYIIDLEGGAELGHRRFDGGREDSSRYYFSLGYRMSF